MTTRDLREGISALGSERASGGSRTCALLGHAMLPWDLVFPGVWCSILLCDCPVPAIGPVAPSGRGCSWGIGHCQCPPSWQDTAREALGKERV